MVSLGIIANPASGKDIRRLVAHSITFNNQEKVNIVQRAILGMEKVGIKKIMYMPDYYGIVPRALDGLPNSYHLHVQLVEANMEMTGTQEDSTQAAEIMNQSGAGCIFTLGGDGTNRMVAKGCGEVPLLPISTGTNNVFPQMLEGTTAGIAAGIVARGLIKKDAAVKKMKKIEVLKDGQLVDMALVDAVVLKDVFIGSRAIWDEERIQQVVVTRGDPISIGISAIAGNLQLVEINDKYGMAINIGPGKTTVMVPIAPGLIKQIPIKDYQLINPGEEIKVAQGPCVIALDGEREIEVGENDNYSLKISLNGPRVIDTRLALREAVAKGLFISEQLIKTS
ncbi:MAG: NAD(+)/NADH kinase [Syntrophomonadaceae bacterium]|nr:NAD(+)/NADH kinase [Syntrophomonadaceae bacterium]MDD4548321.1 NAD(+)/NADH kinase [Syntrophomonadaceae bacterium]